jgi:hypothetical protein
MVVKKTKRKTSRLKQKHRKIPIRRLTAGIVLALVLGIIAGWGRYWYGYFVLGQGTIVGLLIPWTATILCPGTSHHQKSINHPGSLKLTLILFTCFMITQAIGFGMAQPWFDPLGWLGRIVQHDTQETVWGMSLLGGVAAKNFQLGMNGGFWIFLNLFDLFFMFFFLLIGINSQPEDRND